MRLVGREPATCPSSLPDPIQAQDCDFKLGDISQVVLKLQSGTNPFNSTTQLITDETIWDTALALGEVDTPDNLIKSISAWESETVAGEGNIVESNQGIKEVTNYADDILNISFKDLTTENEQKLLVAMRDNQNKLECILVNSKGLIIHSLDAAGEPDWFKVNVAMFMSRAKAGGRGGVEINGAALHFLEEVLTNRAVAVTTGWNLLNK